jgi:hypothetical protein
VRSALRSFFKAATTKTISKTASVPELVILTVQRLEGLSVVEISTQWVILRGKLSQDIQPQSARPKVPGSGTATSLVASDVADTKVLGDFSRGNKISVCGALGEGAALASGERHEARSQQK